MPQSKHADLEPAILEAIKSGATKLSTLMGKVPSRCGMTPERHEKVLDGALQRLRNRGKIRFDRSKGWSAVEEKVS